MKRQYRLGSLTFAVVSLFFSPCAAQKASSPIPENAITVPLGGNIWKSDKTSRGAKIADEGITKWTDKDISFSSYVRIAQIGKCKVWINAFVPEGESLLSISINGKSKEVKLEGSNANDYYLGEWELNDTGYVAFEIKGLSKTGDVFANISSLKLAGLVIGTETKYVKNNEGNFFYWGRRGPSVHLNYQMPENTHAEWFYNEVTVPEGEDVLGSYFMANGFGEGYFGFQVNSPTERRILFSVWSPFKTDNPEDIPDDQKIIMLKKGKDVHTGEFGNEGSGGQSYLRFPWKAGNTYKFLLHGKPNGDGSSTYTAYFFAPEKGEWMLIASFKRPQTDTWLTRFHSFLENFSPKQGDLERHVFFDNQWIRDDKGTWIELNKAKFTADNTARKGYRMDYAGGVKNGHFYLKNCGFFADYTPIGTWCERPLTANQPSVDFGALP